jgi:hypothetical protein
VQQDVCELHAPVAAGLWFAAASIIPAYFSQQLHLLQTLTRPLHVRLNLPSLCLAAATTTHADSGLPTLTCLQVDKYEWIDLGSSFVPSELVGAFLHSQLLQAEAINTRRRRVSKVYHHLLQPLEASGAMQLVPLDDGTG